MNRFTDTRDEELAPIIRGLTFDGEKGLFVHTTKGKDPSLTLSAVADGDEVLATTTRWKAEFSTFCDKKNLYPAVIGIEGRDAQFGLGTNYDEAVRGQGVSSIVSLPPSTLRDDLIRDKIALVTGGASPFGEAMVRALSEIGAFVYIADDNQQEAEDIAASINYIACITIAKALYVDVANKASVTAMMDEVGRQTGGLDLFVGSEGFSLCSKSASHMMALQNSASKRYFTDFITINSNVTLTGAAADVKHGSNENISNFVQKLFEDNVKVNTLSAEHFKTGEGSDPMIAEELVKAICSFVEQKKKTGQSVVVRP